MFSCFGRQTVLWEKDVLGIFHSSEPPSLLSRIIIIIVVVVVMKGNQS